MRLGFWSHCLLCAVALQPKSGLGKEPSHDLCAAPSTGKGPAAVISFLQACISRAGGVTGKERPRELPQSSNTGNWTLAFSGGPGIQQMS